MTRNKKIRKLEEEDDDDDESYGKDDLRVTKVEFNAQNQEEMLALEPKVQPEKSGVKIECYSSASYSNHS
jgi:hypothetical protein